MVLDNVYIFDIETNGLLKEADRIHVLSVGKVVNGELKVRSITDYDQMKDFFMDETITKIGHNIIQYDIPVVEKILGINPPKENLIDTLPVSWYLFPELLKHRLESYGEMFGVPKPHIDDWENQTLEEYKHRCQEDVKINHLLWQEQLSYLREMYDNDDEIIHCVDYLAFKMHCLRDQEIVGVRFDVEWCETAISKLNSIIEPKLRQLESVMPKVEVTKKVKRPKESSLTKKGGLESVAGQKWRLLCEEYGVPFDYEEEFEIVSGYKEPNANSDSQIKNFLFSLGWNPRTFNTTKNKEKGTQKEVPQVYDKKKGSGAVCDSVIELYEKVPELELLEGLGVLGHRKSLLEGMLEAAIDTGDGNIRVYGTARDYTNTLRLKHTKPLVNLPKVGTPYGEEIRGCLINDEGYVLCGSDLNNIESVTRNHYLFPYDPDYVRTMDDPLYDSHIDIAVVGNMITKEEGELYVKIDKEIIEKPTEDQMAIFKKIKPIRSKAKNTNFGATYGSGAATLAKTGNMPLSEAKKLLEIYWQRNWAIRAFAEDCSVKVVQGQKWIKNPVSKIWIYLRSEKDRFSSVNQSSAVFVFDMVIKNLRKLGVIIQYQVHDEVLFSVPIGKEKETKNLIQKVMDIVNDELKLNVTVKMTPQFGNRYSDCH